MQPKFISHQSGRTGLIFYEYGIGSKMFPRIHEAIIGHLTGLNSLVQIFHLHRGHTPKRFHQGPPADKCHGDRFHHGLVGNPKSDQREMRSLKGLSHECLFRCISKDIEVIQFWPDSPVSSRAIHAAFYQGLKNTFFGKFLHKKRGGKDPQL